MSTLVLTIKNDRTQGYLQEHLQLSGRKYAGKKELEKFLGAIGPIYGGTVDVQTGSADPVAASNTLTLASVIATDTVTIGGVTFTFTSSPSAETDVEVDGATDADDAEALKAAINAHSTLSQVVVATRSSAVVTVTALQKGVVGNFITLAQSGGTITIGGSGSALESGTGGVTEAATTYTFE